MLIYIQIKISLYLYTFKRAPISGPETLEAFGPVRTWVTSGGDDCSTGPELRGCSIAVARRKTVAATVAGGAVGTVAAAVAGSGGARGHCTCCCRAPAAVA